MDEQDHPIYRQGDILLEPIKDLNLKNMKPREDNILAIGEATGHRHWLDTTNPSIYEDNHGNEFVHLIENTFLVHSGPDQEPVYTVEEAQKKDLHIALNIRAGQYIIRRGIMLEDPFLNRTRPVID